MKPESFTARSLVGMTMGARKRAVRKAQAAVLVLLKGQPADPVKFTLLRRLLYRIGELLRPCPGCMECDPKGFASMCDGSGVLPARQTAKSYKDDAPLQALRDWSHR